LTAKILYARIIQKGDKHDQLKPNIFHQQAQCFASWGCRFHGLILDTGESSR
jgi:hypothetical protein